MQRCDLGGQAEVEALGEALRQCASLTCLDLRGCWGEGGGLALARMLAGVVGRPACGGGERTGPEGAQGLCQGPRSLVELELAECGLGEAGIGLVLDAIEALSPDEASKQGECAGRAVGVGVRVLDVGFNGIGQLVLCADAGRQSHEEHARLWQRVMDAVTQRERGEREGEGEAGSKRGGGG